MARCPECGFTNADDAVNCKKCGTSLSGAAASAKPQSPQNPPAANEGAKTVAGSGASGPAWDSPAGGNAESSASSVGSKTVVGGSASMPAWDTPASGSSDNGGAATERAGGAEAIKCNDCGFYPLRTAPAADSPCPNCGNTGSAEAAKADDAEKSSGAAEAQDRLAAAPRDAAKTMMLSDLTPDEEEKAGFALVDEKTQKAQEFEGEAVSLNREVLDTDNMSISGANHAEVTFKDGKWFLKDTSSNGATFVQVQGDVELTNGTKILLGNKIYTFKSE